MRGWGRLADPFQLGEWAGLGPREDKVPSCLLAAASAAGHRALLWLRPGAQAVSPCHLPVCWLQCFVSAGEGRGPLGLRTPSQDEAIHSPGLEHWFPPRRRWLC